MNHKSMYSKKAEKYARYRWDYAPEAIEAIFSALRFRAEPFIADIGAGTGILTRHLALRASEVYAIEPNHEMREQAVRELERFPNVYVLDATAEQTGLVDASIDLITVAQAIHWFDPQPTRSEFLRVLKPGGWLALLRNQAQPDALTAAIEPVCTPEYGVDSSVHSAPSHRTPPEFYYADQPARRLVFPFTFRQNWQAFFGALCSASFMPDEDHPRFAEFERQVHAIFDQHSPDGWHAVNGETELILGQPKGSSRV